MTQIYNKNKKESIINMQDSWIIILSKMWKIATQRVLSIGLLFVQHCIFFAKLHYQIYLAVFLDENLHFVSRSL